MKQIIIVLFLLVNVNVNAKDSTELYYSHPKEISLSSVWKITFNDSSRFSDTNYNDTYWIVENPTLNMKLAGQAFKGIAWFRKVIVIDSEEKVNPMIFVIEHLGASEIYLDGKLLRRYGKIKNADSSEYENPFSSPIILPYLKNGKHLLAIRYANYDYLNNYKIFKYAESGIRVKIGPSNALIENESVENMVISFIGNLLIGIFGTLTLLHFLLWLFYRSDKSNLFFCLLTACLLFFTFFVMTNALHIGIENRLASSLLLLPLGISIFYLLNHFVYTLFNKRKGILYYIILILYCALLVLNYIEYEDLPIGVIILISLVSLDVTIRVISAIRNKTPGSKIIGVGFLFFTLFLLALISLGFIASILSTELTITPNAIWGILIVIILTMAILSIPLTMSVYLSWKFSAINKNLSSQLEAVKTLSEKTIEQEQEKIKIISSQNELLEQNVDARTAELKAEKKKSDDLLLNILPEEVANELKETGKATAKLFNNVSVIFTDFVNFTGISETMTPEALVTEIDRCFKAVDGIIEKHGLEKIKTIGDAYLAVSGLPNASPNHAHQAINAAIEIQKFMEESKGLFTIRIGIHSGSVVAGIVGVKKYAYDIWGDTVNTAARMEQNSESNKINISGATYELVKNDFSFIHRGRISAKNKGEIDMYYLA